eukprot:Hpha_TRINITY_DN34868_c0_g1::TRINITY_DN34868_c0_g1_i1::g.167894::m.167894
MRGRCCLRRAARQVSTGGEDFFSRQQKADFEPSRWGEAAVQYRRAFGVKFETYAGAALDVVAQRLGATPETPLKLIDVGCGAGAVATAFSRHRLAAPGSQVLSTDFSSDMVNVCQDSVSSLPKTIEWKCEVRDGQALGGKDGEFDAATAMFSLLFFPDRVAGLRELRRVLRPGGCAVIGAWAPVRELEWIDYGNESLKRVFGARLATLRPTRGSIPNFQCYAKKEAFVEDLTRAGLREPRVEAVTRRFYLKTKQDAADMWRDMAVSFPTLSYAITELCPENAERKEAEAAVAAEFATLVASRGCSDPEAGGAVGYVDGTALLGSAIA